MREDTCIVAGCGRASRTLGLCAGHYRQFWKHGKITNINLQMRRGRSEVRLCSVPECGRTHLARGLCKTHYYQKHVRPQDNPRRCSVDGCDKPHLARGMCSAHYTRVYNYGSVDAVHGFGEAKERRRREMQDA